jgi:hypothetical protein
MCAWNASVGSEKCGEESGPESEGEIGLTVDSECSRKLGVVEGGLTDVADAESVGLRAVVAEMGDAQGSFPTSCWEVAAAAAASCSRRRYLNDASPRC